MSVVRRASRWMIADAVAFVAVAAVAVAAAAATVPSQTGKEKRAAIFTRAGRAHAPGARLRSPGAAGNSPIASLRTRPLNTIMNSLRESSLPRLS